MERERVRRKKQSAVGQRVFACLSAQACSNHVAIPPPENQPQPTAGWQLRTQTMTGKPEVTKRSGRLAGIIIASAIAVVMVGIISFWWIGRPKQAAERFMGLVSAGQFEEANGMLVEPASIERDAGGNVEITTSDGKTVTLTKSDLPLTALDHLYYQPRKENLDYLTGRYHFPMVSAGPPVQSELSELSVGPSVQSELSEPAKLSFVVTSQGIVIDAVKLDRRVAISN